jgi:hypothetical protein
MRILRVSDYRGAVLRAIVDAESALPCELSPPSHLQSRSAGNEAHGPTVLRTDEFVVTSEETGSAETSHEQEIP